MCGDDGSIGLARVLAWADPRRRAPHRLELGTLNRVYWFNETRLHSGVGYVPAVDFEAEHYRHINTRQRPQLGEPSLH